MNKKFSLLVSICLLTFCISAVSFAAIDFDNSSFSPNFTNLNISNDLQVNNILNIKQINSIPGDKGGSGDILINSQIDFSQPIYGTFAGNKLRITSETEVAQNLSADNITSNSLTTGDVTLESISSSNPNLPSLTINEIINTNNTISKLGISGQNAIYQVKTRNNFSNIFKYAYCAPGDMLLSCSNYNTNYSIPFKSLIIRVREGSNAPNVYNPSNTQGCATYFVEKSNGLILSQYNPPSTINTYTSGVTALCLDLN